MSISPWTRNPFALSLRACFALISPILFFQIASIGAFSQTTNFAIGTTVQHQNVQHLGINLAGQNYYDSGQMLRNLIQRNPGFEGQEWQSALDCVAVTATSCTDSNPWNVWPANLLAGATFEVVNGAAEGETGTISGNTISAYEAGNTTNPSYGLTVNFTAPLATPLQAGDFIIVRMTVPGDPTAGWWPFTSGGGSLSADTTDIASDSPGKQALEVSASGSGQTAGVVSYFDTFSGRSFLQLNGTYTLTFKAKGLGGNNQLSVLVERLAQQQGNVVYLSENVNLTGQWQDYTYTFTANEDGTYIGPVQVVFSASGASLYLDDVALTEAAAPDNPTAYRNAVVERLRQLNPGIIRLMTGQDIGSTIDDELAVPFARMPAQYGSQSTEQDDIPMGLHEFLTLCQAVGAEPWFTTSGEISATDMQNLIEYLAGPSSTPYGAIRASLGQQQPWTTVFPVIHLELGNEMWNPSGFPGEQIDDPVAYGERTTAIFGAARSSPYYNAGSFDLIMGGFGGDPWWTQQEMLNASGFDSVDAAPYLFNTFSDYSSTQNIFGPMFAQPEEMDSTSSGIMAQNLQVALGGTPPANLEVYEVNLGTSSGTAPQNEVTQVVAGVGSGIAVADHMLLMMRDLGVTVQNLFALPEYANGFTNTNGGSETMPLWGSVIDMGGETNLNRPTYLAEQLANSAILPTMLSITVSGANPTWNQPLSANDTVFPIQLSDAHYLQSFAFTDGTNYSVIVFNLSLSGSLPITFSGPNAPSGNVLVSQLTSQNPTDNNENLTSDTPVVSTTQTNVANFNPSNSYSLPPFSMTVFQWPNASLPPTNTVLVANPTSGVTGQQITLTATVTSQSGSNTPTGTVTFLNGATTLGTATLNSSGVATFNIASLPAGSDPISASYGGDSDDASSISQAVTVTITSDAVPTTTSLTASPTQASTGQSVTLTATVTPQSGSAVPQGTVTFLNGTASLGTGTLNSSGVATLSTTSLPAGTDSITASYAGNNSDAASVSAAVTVSVTQTVSATATTLAASATQITAGQNVIFNATVTAQSGSTPTGTVTFLDGATQLGTGTLNSSGVASFSTSALSNGSNSITASYAGTASDQASVSPAVTVTVAQGAVSTTTALTTSATQITAGQSVTFTANVAAQSGTATPSGTVAFLDGSTIIGAATLNSSGVATFTTTALPAGTDSITASYGGSTGCDSSTSPAVTVAVTQTQTATTTTLTASATQINSGQSVTLTATVAPKSGTATPTGAVTFLDGTTSIGTATLNGSGVASLSISTLAVGTHSITASYGGNSGDSSSTSAAVEVVVAQAQAATTTTLTASLTSINTGQSVTFTATVSAGAGGSAPTGTVAFLDGGGILGTATLNASGVATFATAALPAGTQSITASYSGSTTESSSVSGAVIVQVTQTVISTTTALTASATQITTADSVVLTATVSAGSGGAAPAGSVTFLDGSSILGTVALNGNGVAFFSTSSLTAGTHTITASYSGSTTDAKSTSTPVTLTVTQAAQPTTTSLTASAAQIAYGSSVTLTAIVAQQPGGPLPTGAVAFLDGGTIIATVQLNGSAVAILNTRSLAVGAHSITASFVGNAANASSVSAPVLINVFPSQSSGPSSTTISLIASATQITSGQSVTFTATLVSGDGSYALSGPVTFLDGSTPLGTSQVNGSGVATFSTSTLSVGTNSIVAVYGGNDQTASATSSPISVVVSAPAAPPAAPVLAATNTSLTASASQVTAGDPVSFTAAVTEQTGSGIPSGGVQFLDGASVLGSASLTSGTATFTTSSLAVGTHSITAVYGGDTANGGSTSTAVSVVVAAAGTPGYTMTVSSSDVSVTPGQVANLTVTLTPENGFNMPVNLTCSSPLAGTTCSFSPPTVTPNGGPVSSTLSILVATSTSTTTENRTPPGPFSGRRALGMVMPWGIFSLFGLSRRKNRSRAKAWSIRIAVTVVLAAGSLWLSGCGYHVNSSAFTMTLTSSGTGVPTHTSQITVNVLP